jgi:hypothetical protein
VDKEGRCLGPHSHPTWHRHTLMEPLPADKPGLACMRASVYSTSIIVLDTAQPALSIAVPQHTSWPLGCNRPDMRHVPPCAWCPAAVVSCVGRRLQGRHSGLV